MKERGTSRWDGTFQKGSALLDVSPQLLKDAIDLLLCRDKMFKRRCVHLSHQSLILLAVDCVGVVTWENQRHGTRPRTNIKNTLINMSGKGIAEIH